MTPEKGIDTGQGGTPEERRGPSQGPAGGAGPARVSPSAPEIQGQASQWTPAKPRKKWSRKRKGLIVIIVVIAVAVVIGLWGTAPSGYLTVNDIMNHQSQYLGKTVEVKGAVDDWDSNAGSFALSDGSMRLNVTYTALPEGFNNGKDVVVKGVLKNDPALVLESLDIKVGCPSKY